MSRMGKKPIELDGKAEIRVAGSDVTVTGPKGELSLTLPATITVRQEEKRLLVENSSDVRETKANHGLARSLLQGMVTGVTTGFTRELEIQGVGYRGQCKGQQLTLNLGYSNPVEYDVPEGVSVSMPAPTRIVFESIDKQKVGQVAATVRGFRPPDSYKGKGVRYLGEQVSLKEGKTVG